jgi:hypothetical protein
MDQQGQLTELAERLLNPRYPTLQGTAEGPRLLPGDLPADLPFELPLPPESRLIGSFVGPSGGPRPGAPVTGRIVQVVADVPTGPAETLTWYDQAMMERGWQPPPEEAHFHCGGFSPFSGLPPSRTFCRGPRGPLLTVTVHDRPAGGATIRMHLDTATPGPCAFLGRHRQIPPNDDPIPMLQSPQGVMIWSMGAGGGGDSWHSSALAETDLSVDDLEARFAEQLAAGGWSQRARGVEGPLAWSTWTIPGEEGWQGLFFVVAEPEPNRRYLHVRVTLDERSGPGAASGWVSYAGR